MMDSLSRRFPAHVVRWYAGTLIAKPYAIPDFLVGVRGQNPFCPVGGSNPVETGRFKILTDPEDVRKGVSSSLQLYGTYDPELSWVVEQLVDSESTVIDVGANIGWYTLLAAVVARRVVALEPEPRNFTLLSRSVALNGLHNVELRQEVVSDREGEVDLYLSDTNKGGHSIVWKGPSSVKVHSTTLEQIVGELGILSIDLLKIDAESAEPRILRGFTKGLESGLAKYIILEFSPMVWGKDRDLLKRVFELYRVYEFRRPIPLLTRRKSIDELPKLKQVMLVMEHRGLSGS